MTLTGLGGVGKTRLALQVAADRRDDFADGAWFVPLASVRDGDGVLAAIAHALELPEAATRPLEAQMQDTLREQRLLLLLDNFEQALAAAPVLTRLLTSCPNLHLLVTSRAALHLSGEYEFPVAPLPVPALTPLPAPADLAQVATVQLFVQRVQAILPDFALTIANAHAIAEICVRLDGLPLAIELAAARSKLLPPQTLLSRLPQQLEILTRGAQDLPVRQQTLRNTLQWSYDLLSSEGQHLFRMLAVFVGGCTLEAAEAVYLASQTEQASGTARAAVLEDAATLLDNNLVQLTARTEEAPRLVMLETLRAFGLEHLAHEREMEAAREAHAHFYANLAEQAAQELQGPKQAQWLHRLEQEHNNLRAALSWALEEREESGEAAGQSLARRQVASRLSVALETFWVQRGHCREARTVLERILATCGEERTTLSTRVLQVAAYVAILQGDYQRAEGWAKRSLAICRDLQEMRGMARSLFLLGRITYPQGKTAEALALMEERVSLLRRIGTPGVIADALFHLAFELSAHGQYQQGLALFEEAQALFEQAGNELMVGVTLVQSAYVLWCSLGDATTMRLWLQEGQVRINAVGSRHWSAYASCILGLLTLGEGDTVSAARLIEEGLAGFREMDAGWYVAAALHWLGRVRAQQGDLSAARRAYQDSLALAQQQGEQFITPFNLDGLASIAAAQGELRWAAQLWGVAEALHEATAIPLPPVDRAGYVQAVRSARARVGSSAFAAAWQKGRRMELGQALAAHGCVPLTPVTSYGSDGPGKPVPSAAAGLTAREVEVLRLVAQGLSDAQVAEQLIIGPRTVNWHLTSIYSKLQLSSRSAATRYALERHLV